MKDSEYAALNKKAKGATVFLEVDFMELGIVLGSIKLMLKHPDVEAFSPSYHEYVKRLQSKVLSKYVELGLTGEQISDIEEQFV